MQDDCSTLDCCANCGVAAVDEIELKPCPHCGLVHYCSIKCQKEHRPKHKRECKQRATELRDKILFKQPESSHLGDCPICFLPLPLGNDHTTYQSCCGQLLCSGCSCANSLCAWKQGHEIKCPFCRKINDINSKGEEQGRTEGILMRAEANDPIALQEIGLTHYEEEDYENAYRFWTRAAELGDVDATYKLGLMYIEGEFVEQDTAIGISIWEAAAVQGHVEARFMLGGCEKAMERFDRAVKHLLISASLGHNRSIKELKECYKEGHVSKDDFAKALRANQAAVDAMKSPQREAAAKSSKLVRPSTSLKCDC